MSFRLLRPRIYGLVLLGLSVVNISTATIWAQVIRINRNSFSPSAVQLNLGKAGQGGLQSGARVGDVFSTWGISFTGNQPGIFSSPIIWERGPAGSTVLTIVNTPAQISIGDSRGSPLSIDFRHPLLRVGFNIVNFRAGRTATIRVFDPFGRTLGEITQPGAGTDVTTFETIFVGLEVSPFSASAIGKIVIDYGEDLGSEEINDLIFEYKFPSSFITHLPHIADGLQADGTRIRTLVILQNPTNNKAVNVRVKFFNSHAAPLTLAFEDRVASVVELSLEPLASRTLATRGVPGPLATGYVTVESAVPVQVAAIYQALSFDTTVVAEAGIEGTPGRVLWTVPVHKSASGDQETGIAIVDTSGLQGVVEFRLFDEVGKLLATKNWLVREREHYARFLSELFPDFRSRDVRGTVAISSRWPLAVTTIRFTRGLPVASLPATSSELPLTLQFQ